MKVRFNDQERTKEIFCDCRRFMAKVKGGDVYIKCPICKKWHIINPDKIIESQCSRLLKIN